MKRRPKQAHSLRARYFLTTMVISIVVTALATGSYFRTLEVNKKYNDRLHQADQQLAQTARLRNTIASLYQQVDEFLLDPTRVGVRERIREGGFAELERILAQARAETPPFGSDAAYARLERGLATLGEEIDRLIATRLNPNIQYPAMALSAETMGLHQAEVNSGLEILLDEIRNGAFEPVDPKVLPTILETAVLWTQSISQMRIYLANRLASFTTDILEAQARSLEALLGGFYNHLERLQALYAEEPDSFLGAETLTQIRRHSKAWVETFAEVRRINESERWREDNHLKKTRVIPAVEALYAELDGLAGHLAERRQSLSKLLEENIQEKNLLLAGVILLFMLYTAILLLSLELMVFRPIGKVTQGLKARAFGIDHPQFHRRLSKETRQLVDAFEEMDAEVANRERMLEYQARHDPLTALPNRVMLHDRLDWHIEQARAAGRPLCLLLIDLNNFKEINDSLGHQTGDILLVAVAQSLKQCMRATDTVARLGGDEFGVLLPDTDPRQAAMLAKRLKAAFKTPFSVDAYQIQADASIGIAVHPRDGENYDLLMQRADVAMYHAKRNRAEYAFYNPDTDTNSPDRIALIGDLRQAIEQNRLELWFQPQKELASGRITGAEALLRWNHPRLGAINPERIVEIAEQTGVINRLSRWVLERALAECRRWKEAGFVLQVSVNISVHNLANELFPNRVKEILTRSGLDPCNVTLEITESAVMSNPGQAIRMLDKLVGFGVQLAIDDYGTGFSSLAYLKKLPLQAIKIDKTFVTHMETSPNDRVIVKSTVEMGRNLGLKVVAEGIETPAAETLLAEMGCDLMQGYRLARPLPADEFLRWLETHPKSQRSAAQRG